MKNNNRAGFDYRNVFLGKGADNYESGIYKKNSYYSLMWELEKEYLKKFLKKNRFKDYLDFACGSGRVITFAEDFVENSTGVDVSTDMLKITRGKVKKSNLIQRDITQKSISKKFDLITAYRFFLNAQNDLRHEILAEFKKMVKKDSYIVVSNQGNRTSAIFLTAPLETILFGKRLNMLSKNDLVKLFEPYGFKLVEYRGFGFLPKALYSTPLLKKLFYYIDLFLYKLKIFSYLSHNQTLIFKSVNKK